MQRSHIIVILVLVAAAIVLVLVARQIPGPQGEEATDLDVCWKRGVPAWRQASMARLSVNWRMQSRWTLAVVKPILCWGRPIIGKVSCSRQQMSFGQ